MLCKRNFTPQFNFAQKSVQLYLFVIKIDYNLDLI